ncbi:MAG: flavodoxin family protein [Lachnospiraceae bacterium]|nr:flavodoxin family protein [Lachnospiraceae bacterium]
MKVCIVYASTHHGNTRKVVEAIAGEYEVELIDATEVKERDLKDYDMIGFASGIYAAQFHQSVLNFASVNLPRSKKVFCIMTSAMGKDFSKGFLKTIENREPEYLGSYYCTGYNTFGPFKLVGGTGKGHPDETDLRKAVRFYEKLIRTDEE